MNHLQGIHIERETLVFDTIHNAYHTIIFGVMRYKSKTGKLFVAYLGNFFHGEPLTKMKIYRYEYRVSPSLVQGET